MTLKFHNPRPPPKPLIPAPPLQLWFIVLYALLAAYLMMRM